MMANKQMLHELLKQEQEPFHLHSYIANKRSQLKKSIPKSVNTASDISTKRGLTNLRKHACLFTLQNSPAAMSPIKSPAGGAAVFLRVPPKTAGLLVEAAMRIQKQQKPKPKVQIIGFGLFGSVLKILKDRSKNKKRVVTDEEMEEATTTTSNCVNHDFELLATRFCSSPAVSPFRFSLRRSASSSGRHTPEFYSPAASPSRHMKQDNEICATEEISDNVREVEEEKEQSSPVSVLDPFFEDDEHESVERLEEEDDYDLDCSYANVQRAKKQLLDRLRRFEKLAELDPMELERNLFENSEDEQSVVTEDDDEPLSLYRKNNVDTFVNEAFSLYSLQHNSTKLSTDKKKLFPDLIVEKKSKIFYLGNKEAVLGKICNRLDLWKKVEFDNVNKTVELDLKREFEGRKKVPEELKETIQEVELAIFGLLMEELLEDLVVLHG